MATSFYRLNSLQWLMRNSGHLEACLAYRDILRLIYFNIFIQNAYHNLTACKPSITWLIRPIVVKVYYQLCHGKVQVNGVQLPFQKQQSRRFWPEDNEVTRPETVYLVEIGSVNDILGFYSKCKISTRNIIAHAYLVLKEAGIVLELSWFFMWRTCIMLLGDGGRRRVEGGVGRPYIHLRPTFENV